MNNKNYLCDGSWDYHQHSTYSDGVLTPTELVARAKERGLLGMALTDHDTVAGLEEALMAGRQMGIEVVTGVELSVLGAGEVHILGYHFDHQAPCLVEACAAFGQSRANRVLGMMAYLAKQGLEMTENEILAFSADGVVGRPHVAQAMVARGYVATREAAFTQYLDTDDFRAATARVKPTAQRGIELINEAGGVAVLAHPLSTLKQGQALFDYLLELKGYGLKGVEAYHPTHTPYFSGVCVDFAQKLGLVVTCGSDFHNEER